MKKILIVKPDGIGDFVIFTAVLNEYHKIYWNYRIDVLCRPPVKDLVVNIPFIEKVIVVEINKLFKLKFLFYHVYWSMKLKRMKYDKVICPIYSRNKNIDYIVKTINSIEKIVFDGDDANDPFKERLKNNKYFSNIIESNCAPIPEIERNAEFINKLGGNIIFSGMKTIIWFRSSDEIKTIKMLNKKGLKEKNYVCLFPGAGMAIKHWEVHNWNKLIKYILDNTKSMKIVLLGGKEDRPIIKSIKDNSGIYDDQIINLVGKTRIRLFAKIVEKSKCLISTDSAAIHIAAAVGALNVCVMGGGHFGRFYPYGNILKNRIAFNKIDCFNCNWNCIFDKPKCLTQLKACEVWNVIKNDFSI